jgi:hypothetical protein
MIVTYYGAGCFRLAVGATSVALGPISKGSEWKPASFGADIAIVPLQHPEANGVSEVKYGGKDPFLVLGPGEYEVADVLIKGFQSVSMLGEEEQFATSYLLKMEKMTLLYLGPVSSSELHPELKELLDAVDILFVPMGGNGVLSSADAHKLAVSIEPKIIVPMCYDKGSSNSAMESFEKESGGEVIAVGEKFTIKPKDLENYNQTVVSFR